MPAATATDLVWYTAYGSNLHEARLHCYLFGGAPRGGRLTYPGCRDRRVPRRTQPVMLDGGIYFALESRSWTGGMAFYDPDLPGRTAARAFLLTRGQFSDIAAQEMHRQPGTDLVLDAALRCGRASFGTGRYETVVHAGTMDGYPLITFTAPWRMADASLNPPSAAYLEMLASGLHESHGWSPGQIGEYLAGRPGARRRWSVPDVTDLAARAIATHAVAVDARAG